MTFYKMNFAATPITQAAARTSATFTRHILHSVGRLGRHRTVWQRRSCLPQPKQSGFPLRSGSMLTRLDDEPHDSVDLSQGGTACPT